MLKTLLIVGVGSFTGGVLRYLVSKRLQNIGSQTFPISTLWVNLIGCFAIGLFYGLFERNNLMNTDVRLFLTVGLCGGFTTFSTFINESYQLLKEDNFLYLFAYTSVSLLGGLFVLYLGYTVIKMFS